MKNKSHIKTIVAIDNNVDNLTIIKLVLSADGYMVHTFTKWNEAINYIDTYQPALIIMEVFLDTADGRNLALQIKHKESNRNIPIILLSEKACIIKTLKDCKADRIIMKPFNLNQFIGIVNSLAA